MTKPNADKLPPCDDCGKPQAVKGALRLLVGPPDENGNCVTKKEHVCVSCYAKPVTPNADNQLIVDLEDAERCTVVPSVAATIRKGADRLRELTRPAPLVGEDVVEAMADAHYQAGIDNRPKPKMDSRFQMQQALKAAEAMGYTLTKQDRVLPELPEGWELITIDAKTIGDDALYTCEINQFIGLDRIDGIVREGKAWQAAYRAAVIAAIAKVQK